MKSKCSYPILCQNPCSWICMFLCQASTSLSSCQRELHAFCVKSCCTAHFWSGEPWNGLLFPQHCLVEVAAVSGSEKCVKRRGEGKCILMRNIFSYFFFSLFCFISRVIEELLKIIFQLSVSNHTRYFSKLRSFSSVDIRTVNSNQHEIRSTEL